MKTRIGKKNSNPLSKKVARRNRAEIRRTAFAALSPDEQKKRVAENKARYIAQISI